MKADRFIKTFTPFLLILFLACTVSFIMLLINGVRPGAYVKDVANVDAVDSPAYLSPTVDFGEYYVNNVIYLCDSTLSGMKDEDVLRYGSETRQIWTGTDGDLNLSKSTTKTEIIFPDNGETTYIADALKQKRPDYLIISIGINNGVRYCTEEQFKTYYSDLILLIKESSPNTKIILQSVLPVTKSYENKTQGISAEKIDRANLWILSLAEEHNVKYLNTASCLKNSRGYLDSKFDSGDGIHLNRVGYIAVLEYIRTHGYK